VTTSIALGKLQSANIVTAILGNELSGSPEKYIRLFLTSDGEKNPNTGRLYHSPGDSIDCKIQKQRFIGDSTGSR